MDPNRVYDYLVTARSHVFGWVRPLAQEQYRDEHPIGLGSLARTLHHMMAAEWCYMERVRGRTEPLGSLARERNPEVTTAEAMSCAELERAWTALAQETSASLARVDDWLTARTYRTIADGAPYAYRAAPADFFAQLALHEVHHRAQVMHMLRRMGVETGEIDYNALMWEPIETE